MSDTYQRDRRSFGHHVIDEAEFKELWNDYQDLCAAHAKGDFEAAMIGLGLRPTGPNGELRPTIVVQVEILSASKRMALLSRSGFKLFVEEVGEIRAVVGSAVPAEVAPFRRGYSSPPGGVSIAPIKTSYSGTLGCFLKGKNGKHKDKIFILSNRHVLDASLNGVVGGPGIQQQSFEDGNVSNISAATLSYVAPLYDDPNAALNVDASVALMAVPHNPQILIGDNAFAPLIAPNTIPLVGDSVLKSGRTTGATSGVVDLVTAQGRAAYGNGKSYLYTDCITVTNPAKPFLQGGDSGSLLTNTAYQPLGLLFSVSGSGVAYANRITKVLTQLNAAAAGDTEFEIVTGAGQSLAIPAAPATLEVVE